MSNEGRRPRVVVAGAGVSGLAVAWLIVEELRPLYPPDGPELVVLESADRPGGKIWTVADGGFRLEAGPNGFLDSKPWTLDLTRRLGLDGELLRSSDTARKRYIYFHGQLHRLPENPPMFLKSKLLSWRGKLRIVAELWQPPYRGEAEETLAAFARRRLGEEAYQRLLDPMVTGVFAGNPETMSLRSAFPRIWELEHQYGGLFKAMLTLAREKRRRGDKSESGPAGPGGVLTSYKPGLDHLTAVLAERLGGALRLGRAVEAVEKTGRGFAVRAGGETLEADVFVSAAPADAAGRFLEPLLPDFAAECRALPYSPMAVVGLGFRRGGAVADPDGFGFLIPHSEQRDILGILWSSSIFPGERAPGGDVLLTVMMGGARRTDITGLTDAEVLATARREAAATMGIDAAPDFTRVFRWEKAIPQYNAGHFGLRTRAVEASRQVPGLWVTGNAFHGIGVNDCTAAAFRLAGEIRDYLSAIRS
jgi:oxygen-dependent protoporphyrinogen oxidase